MVALSSALRAEERSVRRRCQSLFCLGGLCWTGSPEALAPPVSWLHQQSSLLEWTTGEGLVLFSCYSGRKVPRTEPFIHTSEQSLKVTAADQVGGMLAPTKQLRDTFKFSLLIGNRLKHQL